MYVRGDGQHLCIRPANKRSRILSTRCRTYVHGEMGVCGATGYQHRKTRYVSKPETNNGGGNILLRKDFGAMVRFTGRANVSD